MVVFAFCWFRSLIALSGVCRNPVPFSLIRPVPSFSRFRLRRRFCPKGFPLSKANCLETQLFSGSYFSSKGIRISISNLNAFVQVLEEAFVGDEHLSGLIGRLSNFDIRRMLILAQRTICSPAFRVDDLIRVYVDKMNRGFDPKRAMRAMILGIMTGTWAGRANSS